MQKLPFVLVPLLAALTPAQDPVPPPGGFPIQYDRDHLITYSDGYRTLLDVRYPTVPPPASGWPCLMVVHGGSGSRHTSWVQWIADHMARHGYVTLAYDTGNNGVTLTLNPPGRRDDPERLTDLAEIFDFAEALYGATLDESRLAIMGKSGGGKHALLGAAYSGRQLLVPGNVTHMPVIAAIHTDIQVIDTPADALPQGVMIKAEWAVATYGIEGPNGPTTTMMRLADYSGLAAMMAGDPTLDLLPRLQQSTVPMLVSYAYDDSKHFVNVNADALPTLMAGVPRRYVQITGGHGSAANNGATTLRRDFTRRWCDCFLKGVHNGVDVEPYAEIALLPSSPAAYLDPATDWQHRQSDTWPLPPTQRMYLRGGGQLLGTPPAGVEAGPTIQHRVAPGYGMLQFMQHDGRPTNVLPHIPLVTAPFDTAPMAAPAEILGRAVVELDVVASGPDFQLQAALLDVAPSGSERFVTAGAAALRGVVPGRHRVRIELGDVGYVLRQGHRLRLSLENVNLLRQPGNGHFYAAPDFADVDLSVQIDTTFAPVLDVPMAPAGTSLTPRIARLSAAGGWSHAVTVHGESSRAGEVYMLLLGASGTTPGMTLGTTHVPLTADVFTNLAVSNMNTPFFPGFLGTLDATGRGTGGVAVPAGIAPLILGLRWAFAGVAIDAAGNLTSTPPAELNVEP